MLPRSAEDRVSVDPASVGKSRRLHALLDLALEVDPEERRRVLEAAEPDRAILAEALSLLEAEDDEFLAGSPRIGLSDRSQGPLLPEVPGFSLRRQLGEGGMGRVFLAVEDDSGREVALKMIRGFAPGAELRWRFEAERLALSRLNHPAVAQFYGMGSAPDGSPYVVMEYVDGIPIHQYCDEHQLDIRERLELLIAVCRGVEHAHRRQLLHRDLKPSNLLITESDGEPKPKIIDFGIARALDGSLQDGRYLTGTALVGTPAYMSPEALAPMDDSGVLDTRTDVYSLGVVLYELIVGVRPHADTTGSMNLVRRILEEDPPRPSTRWRTLDAETRDVRAAHRGQPHQELRRLLAGDLDWIVMKAIDKDRDRRYGSVSELAADIERHLRLEPVTAHPPNLPYLAKRFVRRHRASVIAAVLVVLSLGAGFVARTVEANRAKKAQVSAEASADFLADLIKQTRPYGELTYESPISDLVAVGIQWLEEGRLEDPVARAKALSSFGLMSFHRGDFETTERLWSEALQLQRDHLPPAAADLRQSLHLMGNLSNSLGRWAETERYISEVLEIDRRSLQGDTRHHAGSLNVLARSYLERGMLDKAEELARTSLAVYDSVGTLQVRARPLSELGEIALARGDLEKAESLVQEALDCYPEGAYSKSRLYEIMATVRQAQGDWESAVADLRAALDIRIRGIGIDGGPALRTRILLATALALTNRADDALETLAPVRSLLLADEPEVSVNPDELRDLGSALLAAGSTEESRAEGERILRLAASWSTDGSDSNPPEWTEALAD